MVVGECSVRIVVCNCEGCEFVVGLEGSVIGEGEGVLNGEGDFE